jgi:7-cyano-7-deazaguanine synthase in queuosine biosynthesis
MTTEEALDLSHNIVGYVGTEPVGEAIETLPVDARTDEVRLALCIAIAGWRIQPAITLRCANSSRWMDPAVARLASYILAYPPTVGHLAIKIDAVHDPLAPKRQVTQRTVTLTSGGIDSTAALLEALDQGSDVLAHWVDYGHRYAAAELAAVEMITATLGVQIERSCVDLGREIAAGELRYAHIVPARNVLLAAIAAARTSAGHVVVAGLADEAKVPDKSPRFYAEGSRLIGATVSSPFLDMNKTDVLVRWRRRWSNVLHPAVTVTCYEASGRCGRCRACTKRAIAFAAAGWGDDPGFRTDPFADPAGIIEDDWLARWHTFGASRRADLLLAFRHAHDRLPAGVARFTEKAWRTEAAIVEQRLRSLES